MRVAVVAEYYPRPSHPGWGIWAHRQALAVRDEGVEVRVAALSRPLPPLHVLRALGPGGGDPDLRPLREWARGVATDPRVTTMDGLRVQYVKFVSPPRPLSYGSWGRWAAWPLGRLLDKLYSEWPFDLIHAHNAAPAGDAALRWIAKRRVDLPLIVSTHGGDLSYAATRSSEGRAAVESTLRNAAGIIANSDLTRRGVEQLIGSHDLIETVHPGADQVPKMAQLRPQPTLITVAHLEPHKNQTDVIRVLSVLGSRHPLLRYVMVGKGPLRASLERLAAELGVADRVRFTGALSHERALAELTGCHLHVMPSLHEPFGVAHIEAMAAGVPAIVGAGTGAEDIVRAGEGAIPVRPGDLNALTRVLDALLSDEDRRKRLGEAARQTVEEHFSWPLCGSKTAFLYSAVNK